MNDINDFLQLFFPMKENDHVPHVFCRSGFTFSVQVGKHLYSSPRLKNCEYYSEVEIGYPVNIPYGFDEVEAHFKEDDVMRIDIDTLNAMIQKAGGIISIGKPPSEISVGNSVDFKPL